ncbi:MAG TPA: glycine zipper 2TM domain-containing protein [Woeseiaceae bacterium]|nr:glycine zipper 2TM domain-containing protein [Woeseiaceae bacterium]
MDRRKASGVAGLGLAVLALGWTAPAAADHPGAQYDYARVLASEPIRRTVAVRTPVRECWEEAEYYEVERPSPGVGAATFVGAVVGGVVGHQFGSGRGNDAATVAGSLVGAAIGNSSARRRHGYEVVTYTRPVERCRTTMREHREERIDGYRVVYQYRGQKYATRMPYDPGRQLRVRVDVRPAG